VGDVNWSYTPANGDDEPECWTAQEGDRSAVVYFNAYCGDYSVGMHWPRHMGDSHADTLERAKAIGERFLLAQDTPDVEVDRLLDKHRKELLGDEPAPPSPGEEAQRGGPTRSA
jgi:hypothetical protein